MRKTVIAGVAVLALSSAALSYAQQQPTQPQGGGAEHQHARLSPADLKAFTDARVAALRAGLQLTPDQEKNWGPVEQAIRDMAQARQARMVARRDQGKNEDAITKLRSQADAMTQRAADLKKLADAAEPLYRTLSDEQKHRLRFLVQMTSPRHGHGGWRHHG